MIGIVSLVEHLHGRTSDYGIHVSGLMVEVALLFSVGVKDGIYRYRLLFLEQSQDGLHGSVAHAKLLRKEGDFYRSFLPVHSDPVGNDGLNQWNGVRTANRTRKDGTVVHVEKQRDENELYIPFSKNLEQ